MPETGEPVVIFQRSGGFVGDATVWRLYADGTIEINRDPGNAEAFEETMVVDPGEVQEFLEQNFFDRQPTQ